MHQIASKDAGVGERCNFRNNQKNFRNLLKSSVSEA